MFSMTGFGKGESEGERWKVTVVIKSLNGKGLDVSVKVPQFLMAVEPKVRERIRERIRRGTVQVFIEAEPKEIIPPVDPEKLSIGAKTVKEIAEKVLNLSITGDKVFELAWKYAEKTSMDLDEDLEKTIMDALEKALDELIMSRKREGEALKKDIEERLFKIEELIKKIEAEKDRIEASIKEKILERAKEMSLPEEHPTVINEIMFLLQRMDINEEVARLRSHIERVKETLSREGDVGKKLEFLAQEMHREITTLGNKMPDLSEFAVAVKVEVDKIKQQAANVE